MRSCRSLLGRREERLMCSKAEARGAPGARQH